MNIQIYDPAQGAWDIALVVHDAQQPLPMPLATAGQYARRSAPATCMCGGALDVATATFAGTSYVTGDSVDQGFTHQFMYIVFCAAGHRACERAAIDVLSAERTRIKHHVRDNNMHSARLQACCALCRKLTETKACGRCHFTRYCGADCQRRDWARHKKECMAPQPLQ
jgi:hypothetical protein